MSIEATEVGSLREEVARAVERFKGLSPEEQKAMLQAQRESWVRAMTTPCEHGMLDFEQCGDCRSHLMKGQDHE